MACKADVAKGVYDKVMDELIEGRYSFTRLDDNTIQVNNKADNSKSKVANRQQARAMANEIIKRANKSFNGHVTGYITETSQYEPITATFRVNPAYVNHIYNSLSEQQQSDLTAKEEARNQEEAYINTNTGPNTYSQLVMFSPADEAELGSPFSNYVKFKRLQLNTLQQRLVKIAELKKRKGITTEQLNKLKKLERSINTVVNGNFELGIKGIKDEITDLMANRDIDAVEYYAVKDLDRLSRLADSEDIDDLREAKILIDFWESAGTFNKNNLNPFFDEEEIFLPNDDGTISSEYRLGEDVREQFNKWKEKALESKVKLEARERNLLVNSVNTTPTVVRTYGGKTFNYDEITSADKGLNDADILSAWTLDATQGIFSHNGILPQVSHSILSNSIERKVNWSKEVEERVNELLPKVQKQLLDPKYKGKYSLRGIGILGIKGTNFNIFKEYTKEGNETGGVVQRFVKEFFDAQSKAMATFRDNFDNAKQITLDSVRNKAFRDNFNKLKNWRRQNTIIIDIAGIPEITNDAEFNELNIQASADTAHSDYLKKVLGTKGYNEAIEKQKDLLRRFISEKQSVIDVALIHEGKQTYDELSDKIKNGITNWENTHNPLGGIKDYNSVTGNIVGNYVVNSFMDYNHFIPRKYEADIVVGENDQFNITDTNKLTGNYDTNFEEIESNKDLSDFHDVIMEVINKIRENTPYEIQKQMAFNTLPGLMKTSIEMIADNNTGALSAVFQSFKHLWERVRLSFGVHKQSELSYAQPLDPATGKPNYTVNDGFLRNNAKSINDRLTIEKMEFLQQYNLGRSDKDLTNLKLSKIKRFTMIKASNLTDGTARMLANYLHIEADNLKTADVIKKVTAITGSDIEIGKYIRDYAIHTVVQSQSFDLGKILKYFANATMLYAARQEALPILEIIKKHYESIKKPATNNVSEQLYNMPQGKYMKIGLRTRANEQFDNQFERTVLENRGKKHSGVFGSKDENSVIGKTIYTSEERKKLDQINKLLQNKDITEEEKNKLNGIKEGLGSVRTATAIVDNLLNWIRTLRLGYNVSSAITNFLEGYTSNMILAASGEYFNEKEIYFGYRVIKASFVKNAFFGWRRAEHRLAKKNRALMDKFRVIIDSRNELQKSSHKTFSSKFSWMSPHELNQRVEYINQSPIMIAMLRSRKITDLNGKENTLWNAFNSDGSLKDEFKTEHNVANWENLEGDDYVSFKQSLHKAIGVGHGLGYDELRGMMAKSHVAGRALMMFKTWLPSAIYQRLAIEQDDIETGRIGFKGNYRSFTPVTAGLHVGSVLAIGFGPLGLLGGAVTTGIMSLLKLGVKSETNGIMQTLGALGVLSKKMIGMPINASLGKKIIGTGDKAFESWVSGDFSKQDAANLRANMSDLAMQLTWLALILLTKALFWDDDDKKGDKERIAHNILVNRLMQLGSQAGMYINPVEMYKSTLGTNALAQFLKDVGKLIANISSWASGNSDTIPTGINSGESKIGNATAKVMLPGMFKDVFGARMLGFDTQADKVYEETPYHQFFRSDEVRDKAQNKSDRTERRNELKKQIKLEDFDGTPEEQEKAAKKKIEETINFEFPTENKLKKLEQTREEYEQENEIKH